jgi:hypothetical protein
MLRAIAFVLVTAVMAGPAFAQPYDDPKALLEALYAGYQPPNEFPPDQEQLRSERLNGLYEQDAIEAEGEIGRIDFDPFVNGQDYMLTDLVIAEPYYAGGKALVKVTFKNMDTPQELGFLLVNEGGWKIDDVWNADGEFSYDLLDILRSPLP